MYDDARGVPKDESGAVAWYYKAAQQGYAPAQNNLGVMYHNGRGVPRDFGQAIAWYRKAAAQQYAAAQSNLGIMYVNGQGIAKDERQALALFREAAQAGDAQGQLNAGIAYERGLLGLPKDEAQAVALYRKAAAQGNEEAQKKLTERVVLFLVRTPEFKATFTRAETCLHDTMLKKLEEGNIPTQMQGFAKGTGWLVENAVSVCEASFLAFITKSGMPDPHEYSQTLLTKTASSQILNVIVEKNRHITDGTAGQIADHFEECRFLLKC